MKTPIQYILPQLPKAIQLPCDPDINWDTLCSRDASIKRLCDPIGYVNVEEKIDGAMVGMCFHEGHPKIRIKDKILRKGRNPSQASSQRQFASIWNWVYDHKSQFEALEELVGPCSVYGEWMVMQHGMEYTELPSWLIAFDLFLHSNNDFYSPRMARRALQESGFSTSPKLSEIPLNKDFSGYIDLIEKPASFGGTGLREGIYVKVCNGKWITNRYKIVRPDFQRGRLFNAEKLIKNTLAH